MFGRDARNYQITTLGLLILWGVFGVDLDITPSMAAVTFAIALGSQFLFTRLAGLPRYDPKSALISAMSLCLLLRTNHLELAALTALVTIASKFTLRLEGRHLFNPTNFALTFMLAVGGEIWVSPGQWGTEAYFAFLMACLGGLVIHRAERSDVTYAFIASYALVVFGRAFLLGDPLTIPAHQLQNGALLLFAFFMISDPKTTPDSRAGRILFALMVALGAGFVQFVLFRTNGLLWSLVLFSVTTPLLNRLFPGPRYQWKRPAAPAVAPLSERSYA